MSEIESHDLEQDIRDLADTHSLPGIIATLAALHPSAIVTEAGIAHLFSRHLVSVKRAVGRGELPPPCKLFGTNVWTAGSLVRYIEGRLAQAAAEAERDAKRLAQHAPALYRNRR
jgi:hypothetical protein